MSIRMDMARGRTQRVRPRIRIGGLEAPKRLLQIVPKSSHPTPGTSIGCTLDGAVIDRLHVLNTRPMLLVLDVRNGKRVLVLVTRGRPTSDRLVRADLVQRHRLAAQHHLAVAVLRVPTPTLPLVLALTADTAGTDRVESPDRFRSSISQRFPISFLETHSVNYK